MTTFTGKFSLIQVSHCGPQIMQSLSSLHSAHVQQLQHLTSNLLQQRTLTFLYVIAPTTAGPMNPGQVAIVLVSPIRVPTIAKHNAVSQGPR